jgi:Glyoxalase-like domain
VATKWTLTIDCANPRKLADFWALALGYVQAPPPDGFATWNEWLAQQGISEEEWDDGVFISDPDGIAPSVSFLKVPEPKITKNRMHFDVQAGGGRSTPWPVRWERVTDAVKRLAAAGATVLSVDVGHDGTPDHVTMADPEGNEFDVL